MSSKMKNLPNDIIINIVHEAKIMRQDIVWKKRHNLMIRHLEEYLEELGDEPNPEYIYEGSMRYDIRFLENNDAWGTSLNKCICDNHGEDEFNNFADNDF